MSLLSWHLLAAGVGVVIGVAEALINKKWLERFYFVVVGYVIGGWIHSKGNFSLRTDYGISNWYYISGIVVMWTTEYYTKKGLVWGIKKLLKRWTKK